MKSRDGNKVLCYEVVVGSNLSHLKVTCQSDVKYRLSLIQSKDVKFTSRYL